MSRYVKFQAHYGQLKQITRTYQQMADQVAQMQSQIKAGVDNLSQTWEGSGASAFFGEMNELVFPGIEKLHNAMEQAGLITGQLTLVIQQAEEEARDKFKSGGIDITPITLPGPASASDSGNDITPIILPGPASASDSGNDITPIILPGPAAAPDD